MKALTDYYSKWVDKCHNYLATMVFDFRTAWRSVKAGDKKYLCITTLVPQNPVATSDTITCTCYSRGKEYFCMLSDSNTKQCLFLSLQWCLHPCELYLPFSSWPAQHPEADCYKETTVKITNTKHLSCQVARLSRSYTNFLHNQPTYFTTH